MCRKKARCHNHDYLPSKAYIIWKIIKPSFIIGTRYIKSIHLERTAVSVTQADSKVSGARTRTWALAMLKPPKNHWKITVGWSHGTYCGAPRSGFIHCSSVTPLVSPPLPPSSRRHYLSSDVGAGPAALEDAGQEGSERRGRA